MEFAPIRLLRALSAGLLLTVASAHASETFDTRAMAALPVQYGGRIHPLDTLARNSLLLLRGKQTVAFSRAEAEFFAGNPASWTDAQRESFRKAGLPVDDKSVTDALAARPVPLSRSAFGNSLAADAWLAEVAFRPWVARHFRVFRIDNEEVQQAIGLKVADRNQFSWAEIAPGMPRVADASMHASAKQPGERTPFENGVMKLARAAERHRRLSTLTLVPGDLPPGVPPIREYWTWMNTLAAASEKQSANKATGADAALDPTSEKILNTLIERYRDMEANGDTGLVPPPASAPEASGKWSNIGGALLDVMRGRPLGDPPILLLYAEIADAYRTGDNALANARLAALAAAYPENAPGLQPAKVRAEHAFNRLEPFYKGACLYLLAGLAVLAGWITSRRLPLRLAFWTLATGALIHTAGIVARMWIQDRPPVTNLYSSAVFVGWGAALLGLLVERFWRNGVGTAVAAMVGFASLVIAHQLGATGDDSLEVMRAVLDSNFWLATHVVVITLGYSAMFVAGFLAATSLARRALDRTFSEDTARTIARAAYGALAFAAITAFVGTMLGGIWADQSWGRFWGWDPKENGALLIVLWCAVVLHARLGGLVSPVGFLQLLVVGNIVTAWSWFGTNMLGVGLHSYGFTDAAFAGLTAFVVSQIAVIALGWLSPRAPRKEGPAASL